MALRRNPSNTWSQSLDYPRRLFETGRNDYELYEEDGEFVLSVELPGFDIEDIDITWDEGVLNIGAERDDERQNRRRTYHRRFKFPKDIADEEITAEYENGILEVRLPVRTGAALSGREIEISG